LLSKPSQRLPKRQFAVEQGIALASVVATYSGDSFHMTRFVSKTAVAALAFASMASTAMAGGFSRGTADTDILFEAGNVATRMGVAVVAPSQDIVFGGTNIGSPLQTFIIPSFAAKFQVTDAAACAATYTTPFGGNSDFRDTTLGRDPTSAIGSVSQDFVTSEFGATCSYSFAAGPGKLFILGGLFYQHLDFEQIYGLGALKLELSDGGIGYRAGVGYEIPEIALRGQLLYRSSVDVDATGSSSIVANGFQFPFTATGAAEFPQSVELKLQSGVAEGWLAYANVKWTDWSVFETLNYVSANGAGAPTPGSLNFFWRDGWTVNVGVAHRFNEQWAGTVNATWDRGVSTGYDISPTTWSLAAGGSFTPNENAEVRFGAQYTYIESGEQIFAAPGVLLPAGLKRSPSGHALSGSLSLKLKF
jgi:long-chain fatty acid transport protein